MRTVQAKKIENAAKELSIQANLFLRQDILKALKSAYRAEKNVLAKRMLGMIIENARIARARNIALCQDTGMPIVFLEVGQDVHIAGNLKKAVDKGVEAGYKKASLRSSIVTSPLHRGTCMYSPVVLHTDIVPGRQVKMTVLPKGFGCENKTQLKMFKPTAKLSEIKEFIIDAVRAAGADACPPYIISIGIGGTADYAVLLAKKALLKPLGAKKTALEGDILKEVNKLKIGPMGMGGNTTTLAVNILSYPTHIAGLPVAVNINCHALRFASRKI